MERFRKMERGRKMVEIGRKRVWGRDGERGSVEERVSEGERGGEREREGEGDRGGERDLP